MRTRRSPRNQEILWRALTPPAPTKVNEPVGECCFTCVNYGGSRRNRAECTLRGVRVEGVTANRPCHSALRSAEE